jgi:serine/threonine protein kinase
MVVKIADFGLVRAIDEGSLTSGVGHKGFQAPELLANHTDYSVAVDVWSFGVLVTQVLQLSTGLEDQKEKNLRDDEAK